MNNLCIGHQGQVTSQSVTVLAQAVIRIILVCLREGRMYAIAGDEGRYFVFAPLGLLELARRIPASGDASAPRRESISGTCFLSRPAERRRRSLRFFEHTAAAAWSDHDGAALQAAIDNFRGPADDTLRVSEPHRWCRNMMTATGADLTGVHVLVGPADGHRSGCKFGATPSTSSGLHVPS